MKPPGKTLFLTFSTSSHVHVRGSLFRVLQDKWFCPLQIYVFILVRKNKPWNISVKTKSGWNLMRRRNASNCDPTKSPPNGVSSSFRTHSPPVDLRNFRSGTWRSARPRVSNCRINLSGDWQWKLKKGIIRHFHLNCIPGNFMQEFVVHIWFR